MLAEYEAQHPASRNIKHELRNNVRGPLRLSRQSVGLTGVRNRTAHHSSPGAAAEADTIILPEPLGQPSTSSCRGRRGDPLKVVDPAHQKDQPIVPQHQVALEEEVHQLSKLL